MKTVRVALLALAVPPCVHAQISPVGKVVSMISELRAKIIAEGALAQKQYTEYVEQCEDRARNLGFEITTGQKEVDTLKAAIAKDVACLGSLGTKVDELAADLATNDADLKAATHIRNMEAGDFAAAEKELMDAINVLQRAINILEREARKGGAAMLQVRNAANLAQVFDVMVQASMIGTSDASSLTALVQQLQKGRDAEDDQAPGAPAGSVYENQSGGIIDTLQDLLDKAQSQLADLRQKEVTSKHNYQLLRQSIEDEMKDDSGDMDDAKKGIAECAGHKATAEGDLDATAKELAEDIKAKNSVHQGCEGGAARFAAESKSREEELRVLAAAKTAILDATALDQVSFLQVARSGLASSKDLHSYEAVRLIRDLARKQHSSSLARFSSQLTVAMQSSGGFDKVKGLIRDMIARLESEASTGATKKAFCDKELAESHDKEADKTGEIEKISTRIDRMTATSALLREEVATLQGELAKLAKAQAEMDRLRGEQAAAYADAKAELEKGIAGIKEALRILNEYYYGTASGDHEAAHGAASGIIALLESILADFAKNLAQLNADEDGAIAAHDQASKENEIDHTAKQQSVLYKSKEAKGLDKTAAELISDRTGVQAELDAVNEYLTKMEANCVEKAEAYSDHEARLAAEIAGLKEALQILETETTALVQKHTYRRTLRGA